MMCTRPLWFLAASTALVACKKPDAGPDLGSASWLRLDADGGFALLVDGAETFALATGRPIEARGVSETLNANLGTYEFTREETQASALSLSGGQVAEAGARLEYTVAGGGAARLDITPAGDRTHFALQVDGAHDALALPIACAAEGSFHGWGAQYNQTDQTGEAFPLIVSEQGIGRTGAPFSFTGDAHTSYFPMPWYIDARGFGVLFETDHRTNVDLCADDPDVAWVEVMAGGSLAWTVMHGPSPVAAVQQLGDQVGRPIAPPDWALGTWMCMQGGKDRVREQLDAVEAAGIPATVLWVQDWTGRRENPGGGYGVQYRWQADEEELYPGIADFFAELKDRGYRVVGYVNPFVDQDLQHWDEMEAGGMLPLDPQTGEIYTFLGPRGDMTTADLSNPATREYISGHLRVAVEDVGLDGWMADFAEWLPLDADIHEGEAAAFHNRYPEAWQRITRELMDELRPDGDWLMFARSGWTGVHSVAMIHWIGDQEADWEHTDGLPTVLPAMINLGLSGQPFVTHDIAGFSGGPSTPELYWRWTELGAFTPFMRTHDGNERDTNHRWDSDAETTAHFGRMSRVHEALRPMLAELSAEAATTGTPIVRHMMLEFPDDPETWPLSEQFMLGPDLLVAPVTEQGQTERAVYLPEGDWFDAWTGEPITGTGWVDLPAPVGAPPVLWRGTAHTLLVDIE